jgi:hypothetical protein
MYEASDKVSVRAIPKKTTNPLPIDPTTQSSTLTSADDTLCINAFKPYFSADPELEPVPFDPVSFESVADVDLLSVLLVVCFSELLSPEYSDEVPASTGFPDELPFLP